MKKFRSISIIISLLICILLYIKCEPEEIVEYITIRKQVNINDPPCLQLYASINKFAKKYGIPLKYAYGLAYQETRYMGVFHWGYNHKQISSAGAVGALQVMPSTANGIWKRKVDVDSLKDNIELNVETSMKLLRLLKDKYGDWKVVFGAYNSGQPIINQYALDIFNKNYIWE
ncbi:MAG: transglycosylase SLT domain-containing protein [Nanoarchaeota archaeon]|mgnify:CR=1 FL=1